MTVQQFRKRPITVTGIQWTGENEAEIAAWTGGRFRAVTPDDTRPDITAEVRDDLHESWIGLRTGDTVLRGTRNEHYPIAAATLAETYDELAVAE